MSALIEDYYRRTKMEEFQINTKLKLFEHHKDIGEELEYWLENGCFKQDGIVVEGYSAEKIATLSKYYDGEAAFIMLIQLREKPEMAKKQLIRGFKMK